MVAVTSWGRLSAWEHEVITLSNPKTVTQEIHHQSGIAYGMGRSYGDVCLNPHGKLWNTTQLNRLIAFDETTGVLRCEAGVLIRDIQAVMIPRGFTLPVTPGTQFVTMGGAVANDVHGKNHHVHGSFGHHVTWLKLVRTDGSTIECSPHQHSGFFFATIGGLGLTGVITEIEITLQPVNGPWLATETIPFFDLATFFELADQSETGFEHTVSWIDCLQQPSCRGIFMRANSMRLTEEKKLSRQQKRTVPFVPPISLINRLTLRPFNTAYFYLKKSLAGKSISHYEPFFYPLDNLLHWNRLYGAPGFFQYQSVVPRVVGYDAITAMLKEIADAGLGSFLAVLKTFGKRESLGMLSFPMQHGVTLALDFPNQGELTQNLFARLDAIVREADGRIYPAKDARMPRDLFEAGYPRLKTFLTYRDNKISSALSRRLMGF